MSRPWAGKALVLATVAFLALTPFCVPSARAESVSSQASVNKAAAVRALEKAVSLLACASWDDAAFEARLGASYDPSMADFPYVEALALAAKGAPRADTLERVETALSEAFFWRTYSRNEALVFAARLKAETCQYPAALSLLDKVSPIAQVDADYARVLALYGLGRKAEARSAVARALERWPFDARFPRAFLTREGAGSESVNGARGSGKAVSSDAAALAATILSRLYVWENEDRELLLLAVPFEPTAQNRVRDVRTYRSMGKNDLAAAASVRRAEVDARFAAGDAATQDGAITGERKASVSERPSSAIQVNPLSTLYALQYGVIGEEAAEAELFALGDSGIPIALLHALCREIGKKAVRASIEKRLESFEGILTDDANGDGTVDSWVRYRLGRPVEATFDRDQDGYPEYRVSCDLGAPATIAVGRDSAVVAYDTYPAVRAVTAGSREYVMKPLALSWAPVEWVREDFGLEGSPFYSIRTTGAEVPLTERLLAGYASFYEESGKTRVSLENGVPLSSETIENGRPVSRTVYARGFPSITKTDLDGDGYFESTTRYGARGAIASVEIDKNGNRRPEYREEWREDGAAVKRWDTDENGAFEIAWTKSADRIEKTTWLHPDTGLPVIIVVEKGNPREISYGGVAKPVVRDAREDLWWIGRMPADSAVIAKQIIGAFTAGGAAIVTYSVNLDGRRLNAVRTGGLIFAEIVDQ